MYFRIFDYFPYFSQSEINMTKHGNLSEYDPLLGWKRDYFHWSVHRNKYGNGVAAGAIYKYISSNPGLLNDSGHMSGEKKAHRKRSIINLTEEKSGKGK